MLEYFQSFPGLRQLAPMECTTDFVVDVVSRP